MNGLFRRNLATGSFLRNVATLTGATAFSQLVVLAALPILTRIYTPGEYGAAAVYGGIVGLIVVIATFRYELAIPLPRGDRGALHVAAVGLVVLAVVTVLAGLVAPVLHSWLGEETGLSAPVFALLVTAGVATAGAYHVAHYWAVRKSNFGAVARTRIQQGLAGTGAQLALGFTGFGTIGLILGQIIGQCAGVVRLAAGMLADKRASGTRLRRRRLAWAARRYRRFPLYDSWAGLLNIAGGQAPVLLFAMLFSPALAGYYALAHRVLSAPLGLIGNAVSQVLLPRIIEAHRRGEAGPLMLQLLKTASWASFFPFTVLALASSDVVPAVFGSQWAPAGGIMAWYAMASAWQFMVSPLSVAMVGLEALRLHMAVQLALFALRLLGILFGAAMNSANLAIIGFAIGSVAGYLLYLLSIALAADARLSQVVRILFWPISFSGGVALAFYGLAEFPPAALFGALSVAFMFWIWWLMKIVTGKR